MCMVLSIASPAFADDGSLGSIGVTTSARIGPVPDEVAFGLVEVAVGRTWWHRLHVGLIGGVGAGGHASWFGELMLEAGAWLHASEHVELLLATRVGHAHFTIYEQPVPATAVEAVVELRFRVRPNVDIRFAPLIGTIYYSQLWSAMLGPEVGVVMRF
jgi:hypothetical protein